LIQKVDINEIIIDSTYKTNNQKFELFSVIVNCGGYGVPLAYLYINTFTAPKDLLKDPKNKTHFRLQVLREFFLRLRNEDILLIFILMDKDTGQIIATQEAWSGKTKIQLCLWHIKSKEANELFDFIDIYWVPKEDQNNLYSEENINEILNI
ncbi:3130_t:CDS:2, partial [Cetraspora pellucida]